MKFFQPQVQLVKRIHLDNPDEYFLHAVSFCDRTCYQAIDHVFIPSDLNENGILEITLKIRQNMDLPDFPFINPVVHTFRIGNLPSDENSVLIKVNLRIEARDENEKPAGNVTVSSTSASEDDKPIELLYR